MNLRYRRSRSRLSFLMAFGAQVSGERPPAAAAGDALPSSRRQLAFAGGVEYGASAAATGWSASARPSYGHVSSAMPGWWSGAVPRLGSRAFDVAPMLDAEVGYGFGDGGRVSVSARRAFGLQGHPERGAARGLGAVLRYAPGW